MGGNIAHRHAADDGGGTLAARVAARIGQHRDIGGQHSNGGQRAFIPADHQAGEGCAEHQEQQPGDTAFVNIQHGLLEIWLIAGGHSVHLRDVFAGLILQNTDSVINRQDTNQAVLFIHHRQSQVAVLFNQLGGILTVSAGYNADHIGVHQLFNRALLVLFQHQGTQADHANQGTVLAGNITVVDGFLINAVLADGVHGAAHGPIGGKLHELGRHNAAGGIFRVFEQFVDHLAGVRLCLGQDTLDHAGRHFFHKVGGIVHAQLLHHALQLAVSQAADQRFLRFGAKFRKHIGRQVLRAQTEQHRHFFFGQVLKHGGKIRRVHGRHDITQALVLFGIVKAGQHLAQHSNGVVCHKKSSLCSRCFNADAQGG